MAHVVFTPNLRRHVACPDAEAAGETVRAVLERVFADNRQLGAYVLDEQGAVRKHMGILVDGAPLRDRKQLSDPVRPDSRIHVLQALSGG